MIVCVCNGLSDRQIAEVARTCRCDGIGAVYRCLGCRVQCGKCVPFVADIVREVRPERPLQPVAAPEAADEPAGEEPAAA